MKHKLTVNDLSDEDVLKEFVKRFNFDAAVLIYLDGDKEYGFGRWCTGTGRGWVKDVLRSLKRHVKLRYDPVSNEEEIGLPL